MHVDVKNATFSHIEIINKNSKRINEFLFYFSHGVKIKLL